MTDLRRLGPSGLDTYLRLNGRGASPALDAVCAQKDAHTSLLSWFTDLDAAIAEARRTERPILSLRLLGRLDQELSCANSRFFRKHLYPDALINRMLREQFVLHWETVRPVPIVTIDFGDGRRVRRTLTGNSAHLVLDSRGRLVDAIPGMFERGAFVDQLAQALRLARASGGELARMHGMAARRTAPPSSPDRSRADRASRLAAGKHVVEGPLLRAVSIDPIEADTAQNLELHRRIHEAFAQGTRWAGLGGFVEWMYAELFQMPLGDPALGLDAPDPF